MRLYVDGTEVGSGTPANLTIDYQLTSNDFDVGNYPDPNCHGGNYFYSGGLDEVRVYDRALSADEINQLQTATGDTPPELGGGTTTTTTSSTTTASTTVTTSTGSTSTPRVAVRPTASFVALGPSRTMPGSGWFNAAASSAGLGERIVNFAWVTPGSGQVTDSCGRSPVASLSFSRTGPNPVTLLVTDSTGQTSSVRETVTSRPP